MKVLRITISGDEVNKQTEEKFQKKFTKRLLKAGFDLRDPIIRQPRSDIDGADFIQLRYVIGDRLYANIQFYFKKKLNQLKNYYEKRSKNS